jgi:hypothetical protein
VTENNNDVRETITSDFRASPEGVAAIHRLARRCADEGRPSPDQDQQHTTNVTATFVAISTLTRLGWEGPPEEVGCHIRTFPPHYHHHHHLHCLVITLSSAIIIIMASVVNSRRRLRRSSSTCSASGHPHPYRLQPTVQPLFLSHSRSAASLGVSGSPRDDQEYCDVLYKLDLGVESPYLGTAYANEAFGKRVVEEELPRAVLGQGKADEEDVGQKVDDCRMWYVVVFF